MGEMRLFAPTYYKKFKCMADKCRHNCCIGWEIDVDAQTLARYEALEGAIGEEIRAGIAQGEDGAYFAMREGRCPNLDERGLCRIISALGEGYLCDICREHPRFYNEVGDTLEVGLGAACEAAAELILSSDDYAAIEPIGEVGDTESALTVCDFDARAWRGELFALLGNAKTSYEERLALIAQRYGIGAGPCEERRQALFDELEYLDAAHKALFTAPLVLTCPDGVAPLAERFLAYLIYRHASPAQSEHEFRLGVGLAQLLERLFVTLVVRGLSPVESARIISEEIEYSEDNTDAIRFAPESAGL